MTQEQINKTNSKHSKQVNKLHDTIKYLCYVIRVKRYGLREMNRFHDKLIAEGKITKEDLSINLTSKKKTCAIIKSQMVKGEMPISFLPPSKKSIKRKKRLNNKKK